MDTARPISPLSIYLDPNYQPAFSYPALESWTLLYDTIYVANMSSFEIREAESEPGTLGSRLTSLVERGAIVPLGRPRYFDEAWRTQRAEELRKIDVLRAKHFEWDARFDEAISSRALRLDDSKLDAAISIGLEFQTRSPVAYAQFERGVEDLRAAGHLPAKFYTPSEAQKPLKEIAQGVIYEVAGDIWVREATNASGLITPREHGPIYCLLANQGRNRADPLGAGFERDDRAELEVELTPEDERLARELVERLAAKYTISDVLDQYRTSRLQVQLRRFVVKASRLLREQSAKIMGDGLWSRVAMQIEHMESVENRANLAATVGVGAITLGSNVARLLSEGFTRRSFLAYACIAVGGVLSGEALGALAEPIESALRGEDDRWLALIHSAGQRC